MCGSTHTRGYTRGYGSGTVGVLRVGSGRVRVRHLWVRVHQVLPVNGAQFSMIFFFSKYCFHNHSETISMLMINVNDCENHVLVPTSPHLWNQLPVSLRQSYSNHSCPHSPHSTHASSYSSSVSLLSLTPSLFHSRLKTYLFLKSFPLLVPFSPGLPSRTYYAHRFVLFSYHYFF